MVPSRTDCSTAHVNQHGSCQIANGWSVYGFSVAGAMRSMTDRPSFSTGGSSAMMVRSDRWANGIATVMPNNAAATVAGQTVLFSMWVRGPVGSMAVINIGWHSDPVLDEPYTFTGQWQYVERMVTFAGDFRGNPSNGNLHVHWIRGYGNHAAGALYAQSIGLDLNCQSNCPQLPGDNAAIAEARMVEIV